MTTTAGAIIRKALGKLNVVTPGRKVRADELALGLDVLNDWLDEMRLPPLFATTELETTFTLPGNTPFLTIGPALQIPIARPVAIENHCFSRINGLDYPCDVVDSAAYQAINQKQLGTTWPTALYYDGGNPTGRVYFYPLGNVEFHLFTRTTPGRFPNVTTEVDLTPGMENCMIYNTACDMAPHLEVTVKAEVRARASQLRRAIKTSNLKVPQLKVMPARSDPQADFIKG